MAALGWLLNLGFGGSTNVNLLTGGDTGYTYTVDSASALTFVTGVPSAEPSLVAGVPASEPTLVAGVPSSEPSLVSGPPSSDPSYVYGP